MEACDLTKKKCVPCEGGIPPLDKASATKLAEGTPRWTLAFAEGKAPHLERSWVFADFVEALRFVNAVGAVAESEGHHPDLLLHGYRNVKVTLWTHAVSGLTENDFIVAAKIDALPL